MYVASVNLTCVRACPSGVAYCESARAVGDHAAAAEPRGGG